MIHVAIIKKAAAISAEVNGKPVLERKRTVHLSPAMIRTIIADYGKGHSIRECAVRSNVSYGTARRALIAADVTLRPVGGQQATTWVRGGANPRRGATK
jgi:hypothetical protein